MTLTLILLCLAVSFIFSGVEAGILSVNRVRLAHRAKRREIAALKLERMLAKPERLLVTVLMVTNMANIFALVLGTPKLVSAFGNKGYVVALAVYLPLYLFGLELLPKSLFRRFPYRALAALSEPLRLVDLALTPMHMVGGVVQRLLFGGRPTGQQRLFLGREDFKYLTTEGERTGTLTSAEREMIHNVVDFRAVTAKDVMTPIDPACQIPANAHIGEIIGRTARRGNGRWLVRDDGGTVTGVVDEFEVLIEGRRDVNISVYQRRVVTVGPTEPAYSVLRKLRAARSGMAVVRGPGKHPIGCVTWEDLIRKLVSAAAR